MSPHRSNSGGEWPVLVGWRMASGWQMQGLLTFVVIIIYVSFDGVLILYQAVHLASYERHTGEFKDGVARQAYNRYPWAEMR
ncbi:hypothetical protein P691DRAFT_302146 [Macrolepiota fuliginosa MF-IS2]|uniref:Uncharacterized protein n=1 Tax=Macrolepiota fuliginosa MF-IS2 TaxID=1400762 RepID=A0A9P5XI57_9AGAR|nr:hypothetical protein P691DRAFT_302146 [Macrolepiota fuliginosa MF-IS2]